MINTCTTMVLEQITPITVIRIIIFIIIIPITIITTSKIICFLVFA